MATAAPLARRCKTFTTVLVGCKGWVDGERFEIPDGTPLVIGRSRSCDISLRRTGGYLRQDFNLRDRDPDFNTVSRQHVRLVVIDGVAHVEDLSSNGTYFNNLQASGPIEMDLHDACLLLRLGTRETFRLELVPNPDLDSSD